MTQEQEDRNRRTPTVGVTRGGPEVRLMRIPQGNALVWKFVVPQERRTATIKDLPGAHPWNSPGART